MISSQTFNERAFSQLLETKGIPDPDLLIRTSGEMRLSNFLLWQAAYSEIYATDTLWPDFDRDTLAAALASYARRERRYGRVTDLSPTSDGGQAVKGRTARRQPVG